MVTFEKTEQGLRLGINIRPAGYEGVSLDPKGIVCEIVGKDSGALLQRLEGQLEGDMLSILVDTDDIHALDIYRLMVSYKLRDELFASGYRVVSLSEPAFEVKRIENVSVLGGGHNERAIEIVGIGRVQDEGSQGAQAINFATLSPEQIEALKQALALTTPEQQALVIEERIMALPDDAFRGFFLGDILGRLPHTTTKYDGTLPGLLIAMLEAMHRLYRRRPLESRT